MVNGGVHSKSTWLMPLALSPRPVWVPDAFLLILLLFPAMALVQCFVRAEVCGGLKMEMF